PAPRPAPPSSAVSGGYVPRSVLRLPGLDVRRVDGEVDAVADQAVEQLLRGSNTIEPAMREEVPARSGDPVGVAGLVIGVLIAGEPGVLLALVDVGLPIGDPGLHLVQHQAVRSVLRE